MLMQIIPLRLKRMGRYLSSTTVVIYHVAQFSGPVTPLRWNPWEQLLLSVCLAISNRWKGRKRCRERKGTERKGTEKNRRGTHWNIWESLRVCLFGLLFIFQNLNQCGYCPKETDPESWRMMGFMNWLRVSTVWCHSRLYSQNYIWSTVFFPKHHTLKETLLRVVAPVPFLCFHLLFLCGITLLLPLGDYSMICLELIMPSKLEGQPEYTCEMCVCSFWWEQEVSQL